MELPAFATVHLQGLSKLRGHQQYVNTITEAPMRSICIQLLWSCVIPDLDQDLAIEHCNLIGKNIVLKPKMVTAKISAPNVVFLMLAPKNPIGTESKQATAHLSEFCNMIKRGYSFRQPQARSPTQWYSILQENSTKFWKACQITWKNDWSGIQDWEKEYQQEVWSLITEYGFLFVQDNLGLGRTSTLEHTIKLTNHTPFKERYCRKPPHKLDRLRNTYKKCLK